VRRYPLPLRNITAIPSPTPITTIIRKKKTIGLSLSSMGPPREAWKKLGSQRTAAFVTG